MASREGELARSTAVSFRLEVRDRGVAAWDPKVAEEVARGLCDSLGPFVGAPLGFCNVDGELLASTSPTLRTWAPLLASSVRRACRAMQLTCGNEPGGVRCCVSPVNHGGVTVGAVVVGPVRREGSRATGLQKAVESLGVDAEHLRRQVAALPTTTDEQLEAIAHLATPVLIGLALGDGECRETVLERTGIEVARAVAPFGDVVFCLDPDGRVAFASENVVSIGYTPESARARAFDAFFVPEDEPVIADILQRVVTGASASEPLCGLCRDGHRRHWHVSCVPVIDPAGPVSGAIAVIRDITMDLGVSVSLSQVTNYLQTLSETAQAAASSLVLEQALKEALVAAVEGLGFDIGAMYLCDEPDVSRLVCQVGMPPDMVAAAATTDDRLPVLRALRRNKQVMVMQPGEWQELEPVRVGQGLSTVALVPAVSKSRMVGRVHLFSRQRREISETLRSLVAGIGSMLGAHIDNARLFEDVSRSEQEHRRLFEGSGDPVGVLSVPDGRLVRYNAAFRDLAQMSDQALQRARLEDFLHPDDVPRVRERLERRLRGEDLEPQVRCRGVRRTGEVVLIDAVTSPMCDDGGRVVGTHVTLRDVSEEERRHADERRLAQAVSAAAGIVLVIAENGRIEYANPAAQRLLGRSDGGLIGVRFADLVRACDPPGLMEGVGDIANAHEMSGEVEFAARDSLSITLGVTIAPVPGDEWTGPALILVGSGSGKEQELWAQVVQSEKLASVGRLASGVAHEFNNLIGAMSGYAQLAQATRSREATDRLIETVLTSCNRASEITRNLLSFARPREPYREPCRIDRPIDAALQLMARELDSAHVEVGRHYPPQLPLLSIDPGQIQQVFLNLLINAVHAMPDGGQLTIEVRRDDATDEVATTVADTGRGIAPADLPRVFDAFFSTKALGAEDTAQGTGLGLSVSRAIIEAHHGSLSAESEPGKGARFTVRLPVTPVEPSGTRASAEPPGELATPLVAGLRVLVADDDPVLRTLLGDVLTFARCEVTQVEDGEQAIDIVQHRRFDLAVCDLHMPRADGRAVLECIRKLRKPFPVVMMTGEGTPEVDAALRSLGAAECIHKPIELRAMLELLERVAQRTSGA